MTNAEKLAKDTERFAKIFDHTTASFCDICPMNDFCENFVRRHYTQNCSDVAIVWLKKETNAEKLVGDTDFMAHIISEHAKDCDYCPAKKECDKRDVENCYDFIRLWLERETND